MQAQDFADLYELEEKLWWFAGMREITASLLDLLLEKPEKRSILDAGCGSGGMISWLERYSGGRQVFGIDFDECALSFCCRRGLPLLAQASAVELPFKSKAFDLLTSFDVLVQIPGESSDEAAMREMYRVLKDGGIAFVRVAAYEWMRAGHDETMNTQRRYGLRELCAKMESAGFDVLRATYANSFLLPAAMAKRLILERVGLAQKGSDVRPIAPWLDRAFAQILKGEAKYLNKPGRHLPAGLSAICIARKPVI